MYNSLSKSEYWKWKWALLIDYARKLVHTKTIPEKGGRTVSIYMVLKEMEDFNW